MRALPRVAQAVSSSPDAYVYLAESIRLAGPGRTRPSDRRGRVVGGALAQPHRRHRCSAHRPQVIPAAKPPSTVGLLHAISSNSGTQAPQSTRNSCSPAAGCRRLVSN